MSSYVARPHVLADQFVPGYLGDSFGLFPFVHGDPLANQFDGPFLVRLIRKEVTHISGFPFGIESRDPDISVHHHERGSPMKNRKREICTSGSSILLAFRHYASQLLLVNPLPQSNYWKRFLERRSSARL